MSVTPWQNTSLTQRGPRLNTSWNFKNKKAKKVNVNKLETCYHILYEFPKFEHVNVYMFQNIKKINE